MHDAEAPDISLHKIYSHMMCYHYVKGSNKAVQCGDSLSSVYVCMLVCLFVYLCVCLTDLRRITAGYRDPISLTQHLWSSLSNPVSFAFSR